MKIPKEIAEKVVDGSLQELYNIFVTLDYEGFNEEYDKVRNGIKVDFEIYDLWEDTGRIVLKYKNGLVIINGETENLSEFRTEKEERRKIMVEAILNNVSDVGTLEKG